MILIILGVVVLATVTTAFLIFRKGLKVTLDPEANFNNNVIIELTNN